MLDHDALTDRQLEILDFERNWWTYAGEKPKAVRDQFDLELDAYHRELDQLIQAPEALAHDRMLVVRLRRLSAQRARHGTRRRAPVAASSAPSGCPDCGATTVAGTCPRCERGAA